MSKYSFMLIAVLALVLLAGCAPVSIRGSGNIVTREESFSGFDRVEAGWSFHVDIRQGDSFRVVIRVDDNVVDYLEVYQQGSTVKIGLKPGYAYDLRNVTLEAEVTMPELTGLDLSGASEATLHGFTSGKPFDADVSGASSLEGDIAAGNVWLEVSGASTVAADMEAADVRMGVSGASEVTLRGSGGNLEINASGASTVYLEDFPVEDANIEVSGASTASVHPSGWLDVDASGASHVYYLGSPTMGTIDTSGASSVDRK